MPQLMQPAVLLQLCEAIIGHYTLGQQGGSAVYPALLVGTTLPQVAHAVLDTWVTQRKGGAAQG